MRSLGKIWLIDDDRDEELLVRRALKAANIEIAMDAFIGAEEAVRALESLNDGFPKLIICDYKLPGMGALEFLDWLHRSPFSVIPVMVRSNSTMQADINAAYEHGANCYVQKGFDIAAIQRNFEILLQFWSRMCAPELRAGSTAISRGTAADSTR